MRIENVMATTQMIHYRCNNCGYKEQRPYADEWDDTEPIKTEKQQTLF
jgi:lipopolysaccharide biosynthesis regulator YciM